MRCTVRSKGAGHIDSRNRAFSSFRVANPSAVLSGPAVTAASSKEIVWAMPPPGGLTNVPIRSVSRTGHHYIFIKFIVYANMRMIRFQVSSRSAAFPLLPRHFRALALAVLDALGPGALDEGEDRGDLAFAEEVFEAGHGADASAAKELGAALGDHLDQQTVRVMPGVAGLVMGRSGEGAITRTVC